MSVRLTPARSLARLPGEGGARSVLAFEHGTLTTKLYAPRGRDPQHLAGWVLFYVPEGGECPYA